MLSVRYAMTGPRKRLADFIVRDVEAIYAFPRLSPRALAFTTVILSS